MDYLENYDLFGLLRSAVHVENTRCFVSIHAVADGHGAIVINVCDDSREQDYCDFAYHRIHGWYSDRYHHLLHDILAVMTHYDCMPVDNFYQNMVIDSWQNVIIPVEATNEEVLLDMGFVYDGLVGDLFLCIDARSFDSASLHDYIDDISDEYGNYDKNIYDTNYNNTVCNLWMNDREIMFMLLHGYSESEQKDFIPI